MALRVVSLPATTSRMKNDASSAWLSHSPSTLALTRAEVRSSVGCSPPVGGQVLHQTGQLGAGVQQRRRDVLALGDVLGVPRSTR